jgi:hypothetical protein
MILTIALKWAIKNNNGNSDYSNHILNSGHAYKSMRNIMKVIKVGKEKKRKHLSTLKKLYIYKMSKERLHMNN